MATTEFAYRSRPEYRSFQLRLKDIMASGKDLALLEECTVQVPKATNQFDWLRTQGNVHRFSPTFLPESGNMSLLPGKHRFGFFITTRWMRQSELMRLVKRLPGSPKLIGPQAVAVAIRYCSAAMPSCRALVSFQTGDEKKDGLVMAGRCQDGTWSMSLHDGDWAPGTVVMVGF